jgi:hypothetical protein
MVSKRNRFPNRNVRCGPWTTTGNMRGGSLKRVAHWYLRRDCCVDGTIGKAINWKFAFKGLTTTTHAREIALPRQCAALPRMGPMKLVAAEEKTKSNVEQLLAFMPSHLLYVFRLLGWDARPNKLLCAIEEDTFALTRVCNAIFGSLLAQSGARDQWRNKPRRGRRSNDLGCCI